ncbi:MAG: hypothetical protein HN623_01345 [Bdellovibrionales bacterium]|nr:hypothetical protein [Bdellovibrionales bacterium]
MIYVDNNNADRTASTIATHIGFPISITHVSCGTLFGIGSSNGTAKLKPFAIFLLLGL